MWLLALCGLAGQVATQVPAPGDAAAANVLRGVLRNQGGRPLVVPFACSNDDMHWAGLSCTEDNPCAVYLELTAVESVGNRILAAGNIHTSDATLYTILLASEDAGSTWTEAHDRLRGASLDHIQFIDFENGWVSGEVVQPLPRDPFFLITSDGGKTWRRRPLFSDSRAGAILQFWFSSRNNGSLVLDREHTGDLGRYELFESPNGGETWMLRETNERPIKLKRSAAVNPDWRIRPDAATRAFAIERRQGEKWVNLSSFSVRLPLCKPTVEASQEPGGAPANPGDGR